MEDTVMQLIRYRFVSGIHIDVADAIFLSSISRSAAKSGELLHVSSGIELESSIGTMKSLDLDLRGRREEVAEKMQMRVVPPL